MIVEKHEKEAGWQHKTKQNKELQADIYSFVCESKDQKFQKLT